MKLIITILLQCCLLLAAPLSALAATVLIDPGHGGSDPGAIGVTGLYEKEVNLDIALKVRDELQSRGYKVIMTRSTDTYLSLQERIAIAERVKPDILVSIHANSFHTSDVAGTIVLYYDSRYPNWRYPASEAMIRLSPESRKLAEALLESAVEAAGTINRGLLESSVYMVRKGSVPSALIETAFLSNPEDESMLRDPEFRRRMAIGIANGIERYLPLERQLRDVAGHWAQDAILHLFEHGIVEGNGRYYYPDRELTRAEFVTILDRSGLLDRTNKSLNMPNSDQSVTEDVYGEEPKDEEPHVEKPRTLEFPDLSVEHWAYDSLAKAAEREVLKGFLDGTIRPDAKISRAEVSVILDRLLNHEREDQEAATAYVSRYMAPIELGSLQTLPFIDVPGEEWYAEAVSRLYSLRLINGISETRFAPDRLMTRAEAAVLIDRYIHRSASHHVLVTHMN